MSEAVTLLRSIDATLKAVLAALSERQTAKSTAQSSPAIASEADLMGQYGNPIVKAKDPRDWSGEPMQGRHFSECPAEYLEMVAERKDYFVSQNPQATDEEKKKAKYDRLDAARARGWAARIRAGKHVPAKVPDAATDWASDLDVGF